jgi:hypothetical protein
MQLLYEGPIKKFAAGAECDNCIKNLFLSGFLWAAESKGIKRATLSLFAARNYLDWRRSRKRASPADHSISGSHKTELSRLFIPAQMDSETNKSQFNDPHAGDLLFLFAFIPLYGRH